MELSRKEQNTPYDYFSNILDGLEPLDLTSKEYKETHINNLMSDLAILLTKGSQKLSAALNKLCLYFLSFC
ncbi:MAG: hypothetical protein II567_08570 [Candidatus Riflebacteria bacterium]|nr:hypothetical protein [Candidatus Riflebacteria bacterium]